MAYRVFAGGFPWWILHAQVKHWCWDNSATWPTTCQIVRKCQAETLVVCFLGFDDAHTAQTAIDRLRGQAFHGYRISLKISRDSKAPASTPQARSAGSTPAVGSGPIPPWNQKLPMVNAPKQESKPESLQGQPEEPSSGSGLPVQAGALPPPPLQPGEAVQAEKKEHPVEAGQEIEPEAGEAHPVQLGRDVQQGVKQNDTQEWELLDESAPQAESPAVTHEAASPTVWSPTSPARSPTRSPSSEAPTLLLPEGQEENFALMEEMAKVKSEMKEIKEELKEEEKESFEEEPSEKEGDTETPSL